MRTPHVVLAAVGLLGFGCHASVAPTAPTTAILPLRTLHLYETGVGYFERAGEIGVATSTSLPVPAGHLDDALKTLVILSPDGKVTVQGLEFGSALSKGMARAQAGLPLSGDGPITYRDLLDALKGANIEVTTTTGTVTGRLIEVVEEEEPTDKEKDKEKEKKPEGEATLLVLTDKGEIRRIKAKTVSAVRATDPAFAARLGSSLDALSTRSASTARPLALLGATKGPITFGYIAETPIWRASYRLVLSKDQKSAVLQGWALLHNDTDEAWKGVRVSLVNGRPDSFLFPLAAPRYARRVLIHPEHELSTVPQLMNKTPDAIWGDHLDETGDAVGLGGIGTVGHGSGTGSGYGYGSGSGKLGYHGAVTTVGTSSLLAVGNLAGVANSEGVESGALFTYALGDTLDLGAHKSALVPYLGQTIDAEAITWIDGDLARAAVRFSNSTKQTLPAGTIAFFADAKSGAFMGESSLDRLKPGERRFIDFGADLDVELERKTTSVKEETKRVRFVGEMLEEHFLKTTDAIWEIGNRSGISRDVYVVLHLDRNAKVSGADKQDYDSASNKPVVMFHVAAKSRLERPFVAVEGLSRRTALSGLSSVRLAKIANDLPLGAPERATLAEATTKQKELEETRVEIKKTDDEIATLEKDLVRLREHLKALGDKANQTAANPFVTRILAAEDKLTALRKKRETLDKEAVTRLAAVKTTLEKLK